MDLVVDGAGGGELLPGVRCVQVPPKVRQRLRDAVVAVFQTHHLQREEEKQLERHRRQTMLDTSLQFNLLIPSSPGLHSFKQEITFTM